MSRGFLIDSNVLLDVLEEEAGWYEWSAAALARAADSGELIINPVIYSEVSVGFEQIEDLERLMPPTDFVRAPVPWEAAFLAGKCFLAYRRSGGGRRSPLPDFFIGAHAAVEGLTLVTRDARRYRTYFPTVDIIAPS